MIVVSLYDPHLETVSIARAGSRNWTVSEHGRVVCHCSNQADAERVKDGLEALQELPGIHDRIELLQDTLEKKSTPFVHRLFGRQKGSHHDYRNS